MTLFRRCMEGGMVIAVVTALDQTSKLAILTRLRPPGVEGNALSGDRTPAGSADIGSGTDLEPWNKLRHGKYRWFLECIGFYLDRSGYRRFPYPLDAPGR